MKIINKCKISTSEISDSKSILYKSEDEFRSFTKGFYKQEQISYPKFYKMDALCKLAFLGSEVLFSNIDRSLYNDNEIAMVFSNSESTLATDTAYWESTKDIASPALFVYTLPNIMMGEIAIRNKIKGENIFFLCEEFSEEFLKQEAELIFINSKAKIALLGWVNYKHENDFEANIFLVSKE